MAEPTKRSLTEASATDFVNSTHTLGRSVDGGSGDSSHRASSSGGSTAKSSEQSAAVTKLSKFMRGGKKGVRLRHFSASSPGKKKYMEDRVDCRSHRDLAPLIRGLAAKNRFCHFAVFDGHGGANTVEFAQSKLARNIAIQVRQLKHKFSKDEIKSAIKHGFAATDKAVAEQAAADHWIDGCCCVSALVANNLVYISNLGDCRAILSRKIQAQSEAESSTKTNVLLVAPKPSGAEDFMTRWGAPPEASAKKLTTDHTLLLASERARVLEAGGRVENGRVNGIMEVSRSFGDIKLKKYGVSAEPECRIHFKITPGDEFLLLACDGLWSVMDPQTAVDFIRSRIWAMECHRKFYANQPGGERADSVYVERKFTLETIVKDLVQFAVHQKGCKDNCTALLLFFHHEASLPAGSN